MPIASFGSKKIGRLTKSKLYFENTQRQCKLNSTNSKLEFQVTLKGKKLKSYLLFERDFKMIEHARRVSMPFGCHSAAVDHLNSETH